MISVCVRWWTINLIVFLMCGSSYMHLLCITKTQMVLWFSRPLITVLWLVSKYLFIFPAPCLLRVLLNDDFEMFTDFQSTCIALLNISIQSCLAFCSKCLRFLVLIIMNEDLKLTCPKNKDHGDGLSFSDLMWCSAKGKGKGQDDFVLIWSMWTFKLL